MNAVRDIDSGIYESMPLAATGVTPWIIWDGRGAMSIKATFAIADAVGTLAVESYPGNAIAFRDKDDNAFETLAITDALDGLTHEFVVDPCPRGRYRLKYTRTSGGADDLLNMTWE